MRRIGEPKGMYPYRRYLENFLRKRAMLLTEQVAAVNVVYSNQYSSETVKYFWNELSPHLVYRNQNKQIFKTTIGNGPTGIKVCFENGRVVFLDGDENFVKPKPITQLVEEFMKIAGCSDLEYQERITPENKRSWSIPEAKCICEIRGQCPCPKYVDLPMSVYASSIEGGPRHRMAPVVDMNEFPEGTTQIFSPAVKKHYMTHNMPKKY